VFKVGAREGAEKLFDLFLLLRGPLCELDSHAKIRMHHPYCPFNLHTETTYLMGKNHPGANWKRGRRFQVAPTRTKISQLTRSGRIVLFKLWGMALEPGFELVTAVRKKIDKTDSNLAA